MLEHGIFDYANPGPRSRDPLNSREPALTRSHDPVESRQPS